MTSRYAVHGFQLGGQSGQQEPWSKGQMIGAILAVSLTTAMNVAVLAAAIKYLMG